MKKTIKTVFKALLLIFALAFVWSKFEQNKDVRVVEKSGILEETSRVTLNEVKGKLKEIDQVVFYSDEWTVSRDEEWEKRIPESVPLLGVSASFLPEALFLWNVQELQKSDMM